ncbi:MAG TPA: hypothetical protein VFZ93_08705 [Albitalea sp.]
MKASMIVLAALAAAPAMAQQPDGARTEFPADAQPVPAETLRARLAGKVFAAQLADGTGWRLDYKSNGFVFVDTTKGFRDTGRWRTEDGKVCTEFKVATSGCADMREQGERLFLKRATTGEVVELVPR